MLMLKLVNFMILEYFKDLEDNLSFLLGEKRIEYWREFHLMKKKLSRLKLLIDYSALIVL
jgi:hypothetical protein